MRTFEEIVTELTSYQDVTKAEAETTSFADSFVNYYLPSCLTKEEKATYNMTDIYLSVVEGLKNEVENETSKKVDTSKMSGQVDLNYLNDYFDAECYVNRNEPIYDYEENPVYPVIFMRDDIEEFTGFFQFEKDIVNQDILTPKEPC